MQLKIKIIDQVFQTEKKSAKIEFDKMCKERKQYNIQGWSENGLNSLDILFFEMKTRMMTSRLKKMFEIINKIYRKPTVKQE